MSTQRLDHQDAYLRRFRGRVVGHGDGVVWLDQSAFYPESGGQLGDRGRLGGQAVSDVQIDELGRVQHRLEGTLPPIGAELEGELDWPRRRLHMALHTAQHLLSRALVEEAAAETVSARLGERGCTVDLDCATVPEGQVARAEALVNQVIEDDLEVRAYFPSPEVLAALPLRRAPKVAENIRVIEIGAFDVSPCGGTHVRRSAEVVLLRVTGIDREKGRVRVHFDAGPRARRGLVTEAEALGRLAGRFTCGPLEVESAVDRMIRDLEGARSAGRRLALLAAQPLAVELAAQEGVIVGLLEGDRALLRAVAAELSKRPGRAAILGAPEEGGLAVLVVRGPGSAFDCGAFFKRLAALSGGKGGGRADRAEGKLPGDAALLALSAEALRSP